MSTDNSYYLLESSTESLVDFFAKATSIVDEDFFRAKQECVLARYALRDKMAVYSAIKDSAKALASEDPSKGLLMMAKLDLQAERLISTVDKLVKLLKTAAEIEVLSSTKFDGVQLFHLVQQIPIIVSDIITSFATTMLETFLEDIISAVDNAEATNAGVGMNGQKQAIIKSARAEIPVVAASMSRSICESLSKQLTNRLQVLQPSNRLGGSVVDESTADRAGAVNLETVEAMIDTVPAYQADTNNNSTEEETG